MRLVIQESGHQVGHQIAEAYTFLKRLRGLMLTKALSEGYGLHIRPCRSVHSYFMKYSIDVLHLDEAGHIVGIEQRLAPGNIGKTFKGTRSVVELPEGTLEQADAQIGQTVMFEK